jgi:hypothetical protein
VSQSRAEAAKKKAQQKRRFARNKRFAEKAAFHGIRWDYYSHRLLFTMIMSAQPRDMKEKADSWKSLSEAIRQTTDDVDRTMRRLLRTWRGGASDTAFTSTESLAQWAWQASETAKRIGTGLDRYTEAVMAAQHRMPPPVSGNSFSGYLSGGVTTPNAAMMIAELIVDQKAKDEESKAAKAEAVRVMQQYGQESQQVHGTMPAFYDAPNQPPGPPPVIPGPSPRPDPVLGGGPGVSGDVDGDGVSDTTAPEGFTSTPNAGYPATSVGVPTGGSDAPRAAGPGGLGPGAGGLSGVGSPAAARAGMAMPGMPGAGPGGNSFFPPMGAGAQREEDGQHKNKYDDGLDLLDDLPPHFPPVFGV